MRLLVANVTKPLIMMRRDSLIVTARYIHHLRNASLLAPPTSSVESASAFWLRFLSKLTSEDLSSWGRELCGHLKQAGTDAKILLKEFEALGTAFEPAVAQMEDVARRALMCDPFGARGVYNNAMFVKRRIVTARDIVFELSTRRAYGLRSLVDAEKAGSLFFQECND